MENILLQPVSLVREVLSISKKCGWAHELWGFKLLKYFPNSCCKLSCQILAYYLSENSIVPQAEITFIVNATRQWNGCKWISGNMFEKNVQSHTWLRIKNWEVDITADQFNDQTRKIIIEKKSKWHRTFKSYDVYQYPEVMSFNEVFENAFYFFYTKAFDK